MAEEELIGVFIGLQSSSYEYIANIIAPYKSEFSLELGNFLLIDDTPTKLVARVIDFVPQGELVSFMGQKWLSDVALNSDAIGSDIKKRKISYSVKIKLLGTLNQNNIFSAGLRRIPHITSKVIKPKREEVEKIIHQALSENGGKEIGTYYLDNKIRVSFNLEELVPRRTFIFARAGFGKSNLMKLLATKWETVAKEGEKKETHGSLVIFDPDGEYAFTDKKERPGILDKREAILITNRSENLEVKNVYRKLKLNIKNLDPKFIIPLIVPEEKHETIFFQKLMGLDKSEWGKLVDLIYEKKWKATYDEIVKIVIGDQGEDTDSKKKDMAPIQNNLVHPIRMLHDPKSNLLEIIESAMKKGHVIIIDVSLLDSKTALWLSSIVVKHTLNKNQQNFIAGSPESLIKATFAIDEAQSVLSKESSVTAFVELAKEGRKYQLGGIFITQQPSTIPFEILSQADNFFVFHLLSSGDLDALQRANAHYSNDIITQILSEPTRGKCYMWTSSQPFVLPVQIDLFEDKSAKDKAKEVQAKDNILDPLVKDIEEEFKNPLFVSILEKYKKTELEMAGREVKEKTRDLFKKLTEPEKKYLEPKGGIVIGPLDKKPFAVSFKYYNEVLATLASVEDE